MRYLLFLFLWVLLQPSFSQSRDNFAFIGLGAGSSHKTPIASTLGGRFCFGIQKEWNNSRLRIEPLLRFAHYRTPESHENPKGKINLYNFDLNLHHDFIQVGYTAMTVGTSLGYQAATGQTGEPISGREPTENIGNFSHKGVGINAFIGIRFHPAKSPLGMEIILYELNYLFQPKTYEIGVLNLRVIYKL